VCFAPINCQKSTQTFAEIKKAPFVVAEPPDGPWKRFPDAVSRECYGRSCYVSFDYFLHLARNYKSTDNILNMSKQKELLDAVVAQGILPLYFNKDAEVSVDLLRALYSAGIRSVEYTNRGEAALKNFSLMKKVCESELSGMYLGVGTIKDAATAQAFIDAGADYIISPGLVEDAAELAEKLGILWVPGCMTPTEIIKAEKLGAKLVKLFPGNILGPGFLSAIKELFPNLLFMPTGGVELNKDNISGWFKAGVCAVGMGSKLVTKDIMENKKYDELVAATKEALEIVASCKK
jgi:2-dehydro-3-deoxyphosphogluconate aldolase / (4S)-4-hydroxy-2-oxoglutarate aldolase